MRERTLKVFTGGGEPAEPMCDLCLAHVPMKPTEAPEGATAEQAHAVMRSLPGRASVCTEHRALLEGLGYGFGPLVEAAPARKQRLANEARQRRIARRIVKRQRELGLLDEAQIRGHNRGGGTGGIQF